MSLLTGVLDAFHDGVRSPEDVARRTGIRRDLVEAAIDHLVETGKLVAEPLASGCPPDVCGGCALATRGCRYRRPASRARTLKMAR